MKSENTFNPGRQKPKQVLYVWNYLEWGGAQVYFLGIASRIKDRTKVKFVFPRETNPQFIKFCENLGLDYEFIDAVADLRPAPTVRRKLERHLNKIRSELALIKYLKKFDFEDSILHIELAPWQSALALRRLIRRARVFMTMHNALPPVSPFRNRLWRLKFALVAKLENFRIFASNRDAKKSLKSYVSKDFWEKIEVTYTNVNPDEIEAARRSEIDREALLRKFGLPVDKFLVFCLGQFIDRKGRWIFLEAAQKLREESPDIAFVWISNSNLTAEESAKIDSYDLKGNFFLVKSEDVGGDHLELMKFLRVADVFTLPSYVEGLPISLLEAMALGIPSISTNVYAIPEAVKNDETGLLIEAGRSDELAAAVNRLKNDETLRKSLAEKGREWVLANFNEITVAEIAFAAYRQALEKG